MQGKVPWDMLQLHDACAFFHMHLYSSVPGETNDTQEQRTPVTNELLTNRNEQRTIASLSPGMHQELLGAQQLGSETFSSCLKVT
jgi:hypothetical protein